MNIKETKAVLFVDDTNVLTTAENRQIPQQKISSVVSELHSWFYENSIILNTKKTIAMPFHTR
jgi:hypothetical protein